MPRRITVEITCGRCEATEGVSVPAAEPLAPVTVKGLELYLDLCKPCRVHWWEPILEQIIQFGETEEQIREALTIQSGDALNTCPLCGIRRKDQKQIRYHLKDEHREFYDSDAGRPWWPNGSRAQCPYCQEYQFGPQGMAAHKAKAHPEEWAAEQAATSKNA